MNKKLRIPTTKEMTEAMLHTKGHGVAMRWKEWSTKKDVDDSWSVSRTNAYINKVHRSQLKQMMEGDV